jgi:hypothetical protein
MEEVVLFGKPGLRQHLARDRLWRTSMLRRDAGTAGPCRAIDLRMTKAAHQRLGNLRRLHEIEGTVPCWNAWSLR